VVPKLCSADPKAIATRFQGICGYINNGYYEVSYILVKGTMFVKTIAKLHELKIRLFRVTVNRSSNPLIVQAIR
jgi:hypothetical protein